MQIIPAIDIIDGKCVRLTQGDYNQKKEYNSNPLEVAKMFENAGIERLHLVDLDGAKQKKIVNKNVLQKIASETNLIIDFGGGIQSDEDIQMAFDYGASQITGGSIAVKNPEMFQRWILKYGGEKIILGADVRNRMIAISGWEEKTEHEIIQFISDYTAKGINYVICTDVSKDGLLQGPSFELYQDIRSTFPDLELIASGGVTTIEDVKKLQKMGLYGAIIGKAIYEGTIKLDDLQKIRG
jgi:phosphoribosylformimino-5-aminoimidazole carboxamide ribotide isomerase